MRTEHSAVSEFLPCRRFVVVNVCSCTCKLLNVHTICFSFQQTGRQSQT